MTPPTGKTTPESAAAIAIRKMRSRTFAQSIRTQATTHDKHRESQPWRTTRGSDTAVPPILPRRDEGNQSPDALSHPAVLPSLSLEPTISPLGSRPQRPASAHRRRGTRQPRLHPPRHQGPAQRHAIETPPPRPSRSTPTPTAALEIPSKGESPP